MQKIFEEYGGVIVVAVAIVALIAIVTALVGDSGVIKNAFESLVDQFLNAANTDISGIA